MNAALSRLLRGVLQPEGLTTPRLVIRRFRTGDWREMYEYLSDPEVVRYEPYEPFGPGDCRREARHRSRHKSFWAVCLKEGGRLIGNLYLDPRENSVWELGYVLHRAYQGRGYATEAAAAMLDHAFGPLGARRVVARCDPRNRASWRLLERLGMRREAHFAEVDSFRRGHTGNPIWFDGYQYGLLAREWKGSGSMRFAPSWGVDIGEVGEPAERNNLAQAVCGARVEELDRPQAEVLAAWVGGEPTGLLVLEQQSPCAAELLLLHVVPGRRGEGVGHRLLREGESRCVHRGLRYLAVRIPQGDESGGFFPQEGFAPVEKTTDSVRSPLYIKCLHL